ncbi:MAG: hypothetical protein K0R62_8636 [Nonomuraea muscovyensis]|nr:hypothetical protein [Nonomuraea muscovyensis]
MTPDQIREQYGRQVDRIRAREDLTPQAKQVAMARAHTAAAQKIAAIRDADRQQYQQRKTTLEKRLFGNRELSGTDALSARDARERAAQYTHPDEAMRAYQRAQRDGDKDMMRALGSTTYMTPDVPSELGRMRPDQVASLANSELTVYGNDAPEAA